MYTRFCFNSRFPGGLGLAFTRMSPFWILFELRVMEVVSGDKDMQGSSQIITTNKPKYSFFTGRMPFLLPNQQCHSTEGKFSILDSNSYMSSQSNRGTGIIGLMRGMATLAQGNQELLVVRDNVGRPQVSLG